MNIKSSILMLQSIQRKKRFHIREIKKKKEDIFIQHVKNYHSYNALDFDINIFIYIHTHLHKRIYT